MWYESFILNHNPQVKLKLHIFVVLINISVSSIHFPFQLFLLISTVENSDYDNKPFDNIFPTL